MGDDSFLNVKKKKKNFWAQTTTPQVTIKGETKYLHTYLYLKKIIKIIVTAGGGGAAGISKPSRRIEHRQSYNNFNHMERRRGVIFAYDTKCISFEKGICFSSFFLRRGLSCFWPKCVFWQVNPYLAFTFKFQKHNIFWKLLLLRLPIKTHYNFFENPYLAFTFKFQKHTILFFSKILILNLPLYFKNTYSSTYTIHFFKSCIYL